MALAMWKAFAMQKPQAGSATGSQNSQHLQKYFSQAGAWAALGRAPCATPAPVLHGQLSAGLPRLVITWETLLHLKGQKN